MELMTVKHMTTLGDSRGDQGHSGDHFSSYHAAYILEFENSVLAIDPSIEVIFNHCIHGQYQFFPWSCIYIYFFQ